MRHVWRPVQRRIRCSAALYDGEDFELIIVSPPEQAARIIADFNLPARLTEIGTIIQGSKIVGRDDDGKLTELAIRGFEHGADR